MRIQADIDESKPVTASGVKGMKSKPFSKTFRTFAAFVAWCDQNENSESGGGYEFHTVEQA